MKSPKGPCRKLSRSLATLMRTSLTRSKLAVSSIVSLATKSAPCSGDVFNQAPARDEYSRSRSGSSVTGRQRFVPSSRKNTGRSLLFSASSGSTNDLRRICSHASKTSPCSTTAKMLPTARNKYRQCRTGLRNHRQKKDALKSPLKKKMSLAQELYEGLELGAQGHQGLITYMRTDSTRISDEAQVKVKAYIAGAFGRPYVGPGRTGKAKATMQDAHEAIRPTDVNLTPELVKPYLSADQFKLYNLIWRRFVASFMAPAVFDTARVDIVAGQYVFRATGSVLKFPGFYVVWQREEDEKSLPPLSADEVLDLHELK